jgi:hypothetical protein
MLYVLHTETLSSCRLIFGDDLYRYRFPIVKPPMCFLGALVWALAIFLYT